MNVSIPELQKALGDRYRVEGELGEGGMATVYLAYDPKHDRKVAIKVLRPELAAIVGGERFLKEIRTTANLQHPHILTLHDSGDAAGLVYYVMPYVEGESLRRRLQREKQLPVDEAIRIAREVASGLDYAHRHGVVHRDIKPENILLHDGRAMVADFGIALAVSRTDGGTRMTETGMSLGTPNYMSPEQAMGEREITPRSDVYALGCVLYEMLVGEPPFTGPTPQAVIARVLTDEPRSMTGQRRTIPPHVEDAVLVALSKIPADRFASAAQFADAIGDQGASQSRTRSAPGVRRPSRARRYASTGLMALLLLVAGAGMSWLVIPSASSEAFPAQFSLRIPADHRLSGSPFRGLSFSPDGQALAYLGESARGDQIYVRRLDALTATALSGTEGGGLPIFANDGSWIRFVTAANAARKIPLAGGSAVSTGLPNDGVGVEYRREETLFVDSAGNLAHATRDNKRIVAQPNKAAGEAALVPQEVLPDGRILVIALSPTGNGAIWLIDPSDGKRQLVSRAPTIAASYHDGYVAWVQPNGALLAAPWSDRSGEIGGQAQVIAPNVYFGAGSPPQIAFSSTGSLAYEPSQPAELVRVDRGGRAEVISDRPRRYHNPRMSPDGSRIATDVTGESRDVWELQLRDRTFTRLTFDNDGHDPMWLPDGRSILYATARAATIGIHRRRTDGSTASDSILHEAVQLTAHAVTKNGADAIAARIDARGGFDLVRISIAKGTSQPLVAAEYNESHPALSVDDRWLAYVSDESGRAEVYVRPMGSAQGRIQVSRDGGTEPVWSRNGRELFYRELAGQSLVAAAIEMRPELRVVSRTTLFDASDFETATPHANFDVTPDGKFIFVRRSRASEFVFVQNWPALVRRSATAK